jgi:outer membrane receptor protein involved in Fe transport
VLRAACGRSVNRSEFREIAPFVYYDYDVFSLFSANTELRNAYIQNADLRYELYPGDDEMISLGAFYKRFKDPIEVTFFETGGQLQYTFTNAEGAYAYGVEADLRKSLDFVGLKDFMLIFNGAVIKSRVTFAPGGVERARPLQGQSPYLINAGLAYRSSSKLTASVQYNIIGKRMVTAGLPKQNPQDDIPDAYELPRHSLDFSVGKRWGSFEVKGGVKDILNSEVIVRQHVDFDYKGQHYKRHEDMRSYKPGAVFNFSVGYSF